MYHKICFDFPSEPSVHHSVPQTPYTDFWILLLQNMFVGLMVCAAMQTVCMAVGVVGGVLRGHSSRMCHPAQDAGWVLSAMDKKHSNISRAQVTALVTWSKSSELIWFSLGTDTYSQRNSWNLQILASSTCKETLLFLQEFTGSREVRMWPAFSCSLQCCKGVFPPFLDREWQAVGQKQTEPGW